MSNTPKDCPKAWSATPGQGHVHVTHAAPETKHEKHLRLELQLRQFIKHHLPKEV
jgi:hypothetical protein